MEYNTNKYPDHVRTYYLCSPQIYSCPSDIDYIHCFLIPIKPSTHLGKAFQYRLLQKRPVDKRKDPLLVESGKRQIISFSVVVICTIVFLLVLVLDNDIQQYCCVFLQLMLKFSYKKVVFSFVLLTSKGKLNSSKIKLR